MSWQLDLSWRAVGIIAMVLIVALSYGGWAVSRPAR